MPFLPVSFKNCPQNIRYTSSLFENAKLFQDILDQGRKGLKEYSEEEIKIYTNEKDRKLIQNIQSLGRKK